MSAAKSTARRPARERLLAAADELFYEKGVHTVGIDRVIEHAGVAKGSLYYTFGSKDELVRAYLTHRQEVRRDGMMARLADHESPRDQILAVFELLEELFAEPGFRGCPFLNASAEAQAGSAAEQVCETSRAWLEELFVGLAEQLNASDARVLGRQLVMLYDGATVSAQLDKDPSVAADARAAAAALIEIVTVPDKS
jgi:AcrR family transcriptional regulator